MSITSSASAPVEESHDLEQFGYPQQLHRRVGSHASFAAGFSFVSILTTVFKLFAFWFSFGCAAFFWTWPMAFVGQLRATLNFAARYPISGTIFQRSSRLAGPMFGWFSGWVMAIGQMITVAVVAIALQAVFPSIWSGFQIVGGPAAAASVTSAIGAQNAVLLGNCLLVVTTLVNIIGIRLMVVLTSVGVTVELLGSVTILIGLLAKSERGIGVINTTAGYTGDGSAVHLGLTRLLAHGRVRDGRARIGRRALRGDELPAPHHAPHDPPRARALRSGRCPAHHHRADGGAEPHRQEPRHAGARRVLTSQFGPVGGRILLLAVAISVFACALSVQTSCSRMVFSMPRERMLPFRTVLGCVSDRTGTPIAVVVGVGAALVLLVDIGQSALCTALSSLCIAMLYLACPSVTGPLLIQRICHRRTGFLEPFDEYGNRACSSARTTSCSRSSTRPRGRAWRGHARADRRLRPTATRPSSRTCWPGWTPGSCCAQDGIPGAVHVPGDRPAPARLLPERARGVPPLSIRARYGGPPSRARTRSSSGSTGGCAPPCSRTSRRCSISTPMRCASRRSVW
jgi:hypothetical protein